MRLEERNILTLQDDEVEYFIDTFEGAWIKPLVVNVRMREKNYE